MQNTVFIQTYGCQMNEHDSQRMMEILATEGYRSVSSPEEASLVIVNTCSVRYNPENKVYSFIGTLRKYKKTNPDLIVGVAGCVAQQEGKRILQRAPVVDMVFGPDHYFRLPEMIAEVREGKRPLRVEQAKTEPKTRNFIPDEWLEAGHVEGCKAYIAIMKGCDNFCSYCIVPLTRGREVSREPENILAEARDLIAKGAREIWLLGQNVNSYTADGWDFYRLLDAVSQLDGVQRIRFTSPHPKDWNDQLADLMAQRPTICNHLHLPVQSGSDRILKLMNRRHTRQDYLDHVAYLKEKVPNVTIGADLIVGFPEETEEDFQDTLDLIEQVRFGQLYAYKYSPRPGTKALELGDTVPRKVKEERLARVLALLDKLNAEHLAAHVGTEQTILIENAHPRYDGVMVGRTEGNRQVSVKAKLAVGDLVRVRITKARPHSLEGELVDA